MERTNKQTVTIISDWQKEQYYQAVVKGLFLSLCPDVQLIDISHDIAAFDINQAAFVLSNSFRFFPKNTWHIVDVDDDLYQESDHVIVVHDGHYFIGRDNGIFSLLFEDPHEIYQINLSKQQKKMFFATRDIYVPVMAEIFKGSPITDAVKKRKSLTRRIPYTPAVVDNIIKGMALYVDGYGNVFTNIDQQTFEKIQTQKPFFLQANKGGRQEIFSVSSSFSSVQEGDIAAIFINEFLMIAIKYGHASGLLGIKAGEPVQIIF